MDEKKCVLSCGVKPNYVSECLSVHDKDISLSLSHSFAKSVKDSDVILSKTYQRQWHFLL